MTKPRVWFGKALSGRGEVARWIVKHGPTKHSSPPVGYVVARRNPGTMTVAYWYGYTLDGGLGAGPLLTRAEAANAILLHLQQQPRP
jgi:hypothetical protein